MSKTIRLVLRVMTLPSDVTSVLVLYGLEDDTENLQFLSPYAVFNV